MTQLYGVKTEEDRALVELVDGWMRKQVGCLFGRREYAKGRYLLAVVETKSDFEEANRLYLEDIAVGTVSSCLYIYRNHGAATKLKTVGDAVDVLKNEIISNTVTSKNKLGHLSQSISARCPISERKIEYYDFDLVAFYPQALIEDDPLYDPSNFAPVLCINQTSDLYGFSLLVEELIESKRETPGENSDASKEQMLRKAQRIWHDLAKRTINNYGKLTNPRRLCPAHVSVDENYYITQHDEAAFGETEKLEHISEMPAIYLERVIDEWLSFFGTGREVSLKHVVRPALCPVRVRNTAVPA